MYSHHSYHYLGHIIVIIILDIVYKFELLIIILLVQNIIVIVTTSIFITPLFDWNSLCFTFEFQRLRTEPFSGNIKQRIKQGSYLVLVLNYYYYAYEDKNNCNWFKNPAKFIDRFNSLALPGLFILSRTMITFHYSYYHIYV